MNGCRDFQPVLGIPIENEEARSRIKRERLAQLLNNPKARGMPRDVAVQNTSAIMADDKEAVEHGEGDRGNREEIHRGDGFPMVTQKSEPTLGRVWISGGSFHPAGMVLSETSKPSMRSSPWMRGAPQLGFSAIMDSRACQQLREAMPFGQITKMYRI